MTNRSPLASTSGVQRPVDMFPTGEVPAYKPEQEPHICFQTEGQMQKRLNNIIVVVLLFCFLGLRVSDDDGMNRL